LAAFIINVSHYSLFHNVIPSRSSHHGKMIKSTEICRWRPQRRLLGQKHHYRRLCASPCPSTTTRWYHSIIIQRVSPTQQYKETQKQPYPSDLHRVGSYHACKNHTQSYWWCAYTIRITLIRTGERSAHLL
jgi:hypothetical protein